MPPTTSEADIIFNKANLALAKSQRLIASWLPPRTAEELASTKTEEEIEKEEQEIFAPIPELLGLGASLPADIKDGDARRQELTSNDKLRKQLLGKNFQQLQGKGRGGSKSAPGSGQRGSKPQPAAAKRDWESEDEDEAGRSSLGKSKRKRGAAARGAADGGDVEEVRALDGGGIESFEDARPPKKARNYLDEVLAEKSRKKQKKKNKKKHEGGAGGEDFV